MSLIRCQNSNDFISRHLRTQWPSRRRGDRGARSKFALCLIAAGLLCMPQPIGARPARQLPERFQQYPFSVMSLTVGHPNSGWQLRAKKLRDTAHLRVRSRSDAYRYGHPALVLMLRRSAKDVARAVSGSVMLVGDLSRKQGGPLAGHHSHQSGRDADVAFYMRDGDDKPVTAPGFVKFGADGKAKNGSGYRFDDYRNWLLVQSWVKDDRAGLSHIFVSRALRARLLRYANKNPEFRPYVVRAAQLLKQPEAAEAHDDHFHVRIACPEKQLGLCKNESK